MGADTRVGLQGAYDGQDIGTGRFAKISDLVNERD